MAKEQEGHRKRLKKTFLDSGLGGFAPHNALELLLFYAVPRKDTKELARRLIQTFGGFDRVLEADYESLVAVEGAGPEVATYLKLQLASYAYYEQQKQEKGFVAGSTGAAAEYCRALFIGEGDELSYLLCLDAKLKLTNCVLIARGSLNAAAVSTRRIAEIAAVNKAASVILTHNHPGGSAVPTPQDIETTKRAAKALSVIGAALNDHIVVGAGDALSMADAGLIQSINKELER